MTNFSERDPRGSTFHVFVRSLSLNLSSAMKNGARNPTSLNWAASPMTAYTRPVSAVSTGGQSRGGRRYRVA